MNHIPINIIINNIGAHNTQMYWVGGYYYIHFILCCINWKIIYIKKMTLSVLPTLN